MLKDNHLSTVLLLVALSCLIYYLNKPTSAKENKPKNANVKGKERFAEVSKQPQTQTPSVEVKPEVLKQILNESEMRKPVSEMRKSVSESEMKRAQPEIKGSQLDVFNFEANDLDNTGADLNAAFQLPVPVENKTDMVDMNKNNVKKYDAKDFLPKEINDQWFNTDFSQAKNNINDDKLINTERYVIGINTVGQSLKNASYDIRGTVPNPKFTVSPWNNSTYEPDFNLKPLC